MAYTFQVSDLKRSTIKNIAGVCLDSPLFLDIANEIQRRLLRRGNWFDTEWLVRLCVHDACLTWPRYVGTILGARFCDGRMGEIKNKWYSIVGGAHSLNSSHHAYGFDGGWIHGDLILEDAGTAPTYRQPNGSTGNLIRYYVKYQNDLGKKITIYGTEYGGQALQHQDSNGNWVAGMVLTAAAPFATSSVYVTKIDSVVREATQGPGFLYTYDPVADALRDIAFYEPNETNPRYRRSAIRNFCAAPGCRDVNDQKTVQVEAMVKLAFYDLVNDNDFLLIDNFDAFKLAYQAVKFEEANDDAAAEAKWLKAIRELNFDLRDKSPDNQTPVYVNVVNGRSVHSPY